MGPVALDTTVGFAKTIEDLAHPLPTAGGTETECWAASAASHFERHGVLVLPRLLDEAALAPLQAAIADACSTTDVMSFAGGGAAEMMEAAEWAEMQAAEWAEMELGAESMAEGAAELAAEGAEASDGQSYTVWSSDALEASADGPGGPRGSGEPGVEDFTAETRAAELRTHKALRLEGRVAEVLSDVLATLWPLLANALQAQEAAPVLGSGFMVVRPGAEAQALHKDVHGHDRFDVSACDEASAEEAGGMATGGGPRAISIQVQLTDTSRPRSHETGGADAAAAAGPLGSLEVLPGSHRPDTAAGCEAHIRAAVAEAATPAALASAKTVVPVDVAAGTVTLYSSRLWHRGGANAHASRERCFAFLTVAEPDAPAPAGLIHTMAHADVGRWRVCQEGLKEERL